MSPGGRRWSVVDPQEASHPGSPWQRPARHEKGHSVVAREEVGPILNGIPSQLPDIDPDETAGVAGLASTASSTRAVAPGPATSCSSCSSGPAQRQVGVPSLTATDYINTIPPEREPWFPGDEEIERRYRALPALERRRSWCTARSAPASASAATSRRTPRRRRSTRSASTTSSAARTTRAAATRSSSRATPPPASTPAPSSRAACPRTQLDGFRQEQSHVVDGKPLALPSYPHPRLMPDFWEFPTVSMGLGPMNAIYQAQFNKYLHNRGIKDTSQQHVWAFLGDGEMDEPESRGLLQLAASEELDNLTFVVNCNLQRLDGPVRGNGKIIQELEAFFRGAGWNVIKVVWGRGWDPLLAADRDGALVNLMNTTRDGDYQTFRANDGAYVREHFFGRDPRTREMVEDWSDDDIWWKLKRGGHDYRKVYAAYKAAMEHTGQPTVILAKTIKGYGLGSHFAGRNATHQMKKLTLDDLKGLPRQPAASRSPTSSSRRDPYQPPYYHPGADDETHPVPARAPRRSSAARCPSAGSTHEPLKLPDDSAYDEVKQGLGQAAGRHHDGVRAPAQGPDARQGVRPAHRADHPRRGAHLRHGLVLPDDQDLQPARAELHLGRRRADAGLQGVRRRARSCTSGINEAGSVAAFTAVGIVLRHARRADDPDLRLLLDVRLPAHRRLDLGGRRPDGPRLPHRRHRRPHDADRRGPAARRRPLARCSRRPTRPSCTYDPAYAYEIAHIVQDGLRRMYGDDPENVIYYLTVYNEPIVAAGRARGRRRRGHPARASTCSRAGTPRAWPTTRRGCSCSRPVSACRGRSRRRSCSRDDWGVVADVWSRDLVERAAPRRPGLRRAGVPAPRAASRACRTSPSGCRTRRARSSRCRTTCARCRTRSAQWVPGDLRLARRRRLRLLRHPGGGPAASSTSTARRSRCGRCSCWPSAARSTPSVAREAAERYRLLDVTAGTSGNAGGES